MLGSGRSRLSTPARPAPRRPACALAGRVQCSCRGLTFSARHLLLVVQLASAKWGSDRGTEGQRDPHRTRWPAHRVVKGSLEAVARSPRDDAAGEEKLVADNRREGPAIWARGADDDRPGDAHSRMMGRGRKRRNELPGGTMTRDRSCRRRRATRLRATAPPRAPERHCSGRSRDAPRKRAEVCLSLLQIGEPS